MSRIRIEPPSSGRPVLPKGSLFIFINSPSIEQSAAKHSPDPHTHRRTFPQPEAPGYRPYSCGLGSPEPVPSSLHGSTVALKPVS